MFKVFDAQYIQDFIFKDLNIVFKIMMDNKRKMSMTYCRVAMWIQLK